MRHLVDLIPLPRVFAEVVLIVGLFLSAIVVSRVAGLVAAWLVSRRAVHGEDAPADAVARLQQRETAASLTQTSVRYLAFGLALVLSIIVLSGVRNVDTIAGGAFVAIVLGFAVQRVFWDVLAGSSCSSRTGSRSATWSRSSRGACRAFVEEVSLRSVKLRSGRGHPCPELAGPRGPAHPVRRPRRRDRALRERPRGRR